MPWKWTRLLVPLVLLGAIAAAALFAIAVHPWWTQHRSALTITDIRSVAQLVTVRAPVSGVQVSEHANWVGGIRLLLALVGEVEIGTDLEHARLHSVDADARTAVLELPDPGVISVHLDLQRSQVYSVDRRWLWLLVPGSDIEREAFNRAMAEAQSDLAQYDGRGLTQEARRRAEEVLQGAARRIGWDIRVRWTK